MWMGPHVHEAWRLARIRKPGVQAVSGEQSEKQPLMQLLICAALIVGGPTHSTLSLYVVTCVRLPSVRLQVLVYRLQSPYRDLPQLRQQAAAPSQSSAALSQGCSPSQWRPLQHSSMEGHSQGSLAAGDNARGRVHSTCWDDCSCATRALYVAYKKGAALRVPSCRRIWWGRRAHAGAWAATPRGSNCAGPWSRAAPSQPHSRTSQQW